MTEVRSLRGVAIGLALVVAIGTLGGPSGAEAVSPSLRAANACSPGLSLNLSNAQGPAPWAVSFALSDVWGAPSSVVWAFGDGSGFSGSGNAYLAPTHLYSDPGQYTVGVSLTAGSENGTCRAFVTVLASALQARIAATPSAGPAPLTVRFTALMTGGTGTFLSAVWQFGDGGTATGFNVSYTYETAGQYSASFTAVDSANQSVRTTTPVKVNATTTVSNDSPNHPSSIDPALLIGAALGAVAVLTATFLWNRGRRRRARDDASEEGAAAAPDLGGPDAAAVTGPAPRDAGSAGEVATFPDIVSPEPIAPDLSTFSTAPSRVEPATVEETGAAPAVEPSGAEAEVEARRPRLSQRVLVHLYLQGHLTEGEVAPVGFTQRGMADALQVAQSPLSSVLRRLTMAGIVVQDTRHVHGQDRRLRVYRLTPLGETLARDLYKAREKTVGPPAFDPIRRL